ncbi:unnamed protein product [Zymoseptoria tritici ST99CH_3D7]|uniref:Auxiliary Activity family 9 catalytic domain-containing protein n=1 Tax=Zymoseptoria tritici (strain ST99CH_3D7) TaxID=1276538 RepID=A0A1X7RLH7_ZYMT9|nr:unnamed protein product [Zymoseptoria tritici ST99CH_3D7]
MPSFTNIAAIAALAALPLVSAHGYIESVAVNGKSYVGTSPEWFYQQSKPDRAGWYAKNQDNGFVSPSAYTNADIVCHKSATVGGTPVPVSAGGKMDIKWNTWPDSHHGPVITYMAAVGGDFPSVDKTKLKWFKVKEGGLVSGSNPGTWVTDQLLANNLVDSVTVPSTLKAGNYVVRHEIIALHSAGQQDGAQNYPQCFNVKVSGSGTVDPCNGGGASCAVGTALYKANDPSILINIYQTLSSYKIPGPALYKAAGGKTNTRQIVSGGDRGNGTAPGGGDGSVPPFPSMMPSSTDAGEVPLPTVAPTMPGGTDVPVPTMPGGTDVPAPTMPGGILPTGGPLPGFPPTMPTGGPFPFPPPGTGGAPIPTGAPFPGLPNWTWKPKHVAVPFTA